MKRFHSNVGAAKRSLEQRPEVFHAVDVNLSTHIGLSLVNHVMHEAQLHPTIVGYGAIRIDLAPKLNILEYLVLQCFPRDIRHNRSANLTEIAVKNSLHNRLASRGSHETFLRRESRTARMVHVLNLAANKGFIHFHFASTTADLRSVAPLLFLHNLTDSLKHEPCRRLRHLEGATKFVRTDTVLCIRQQPKCRHPFVESDRRVFHDRLNLDRELLFAGIAEPKLAGLDERVLSSGATRANNVSVRPTELLGKLKAAVRIGKIDDCLLKAFRFGQMLGRFHVEND